jgi:hypothetical protein
MTQCEAVFKAVSSKLMTATAAQPAVFTLADHIAACISIMDGMNNKTIALSERARLKYDTPDKLRKYVDGMIVNHIKKDRRIRGFVVCEIPSKKK